MNIDPEVALDSITKEISEEFDENSRIPFRKLAEMAGLDPARDFRGRDLVELDFRDEDLSGFDFSNADLRGSDFRRAKLNGTSFQGAQIEGAIGISSFENIPHPSAEFNRQLAKQLIVKGEMPPENWLDQLRTLRLGSSGIREFSILGNLKHLQRLSLKSTKIDSITSLSGLRKLHTLELNSTKVSDLKPISSLTALRVLNLAFCKRLRSIESLANLHHLSYLDISHTLINTLNFASSLVSLRTLIISYSRVTDLGPLAPLKYLLNLQAFGLENASAERLLALEGLRTLGITATQINLEIVGKLHGLHQLSISGSEINIPASFSALKQLRTLILRSNSVVDLEQIWRIANLIRLEIHGSRRISLDHMNERSEIKDLYLFGSSIDLSEVVSKLDLHSLKIEYSQVKNLEMVNYFSNLSSISVIGSGDLDLRKLMAKPRMRWIQHNSTYHVRTDNAWVTYNQRE